jgi:diaminopimelate decarboxylase
VTEVVPDVAARRNAVARRLWQRYCSVTVVTPALSGLSASPTAAASITIAPVSVSPKWRAAIDRAVASFGTPCYVTRARPIRDALTVLEHGYDGPVRPWLSMKTHPLAALIRWWAQSGRGVEVVSEAELVAALEIGCAPSALLVNGLAKHQWLARRSVRGLRVHFDSLAELDALLPVALRDDWRVGVRLHAPDERDARDERFGGPFGMTAGEASDAIRRLRDAGAQLESVHFHLGQRGHRPGAYARAVAHVRSVCQAAAFRPRFVDCGGGLPGGRAADDALADLRGAVNAAFSAFRPELEEVWVEHGRFVLQHATMLAIRVVDAKERPECRYLICDGGRTNQALSADHGLHPLWTVPDRTGPHRLTTICGPTCMTDDILGRVDLPESIVPGDVLVWTAAGAYHLPWETRFSHGHCAVAWCDDDDNVVLARRRERPEDWMTPWP